MDRIFAAYGLVFDSKNFTRIKGYVDTVKVPVLNEAGKQVLDSDGEPVFDADLSFANGHTLWSASKLHNIITAYTQQ